MPLRNPVLDPRLSPDQWHSYLVRKRWLLGLIGVLVLCLAAGVVSFLRPRDQTIALPPEQIAAAAGKAIMAQERYGFKATLSGAGAGDGFPAATMSGQYQRNPLVIHLSGTATSGSQQVALDYWMDGSSLYVRDPGRGDWTLVEGADLAEMHSFQPDHIATPLMFGVQQAVVAGEETVGIRKAVVLDLTLDPKVMLSALGASAKAYPSGVKYRLWVEKTTLLPVRFRMDVDGVAVGGAITHSFAYQLDWDFKQAATLEVPQAIRANAKVAKPPERPLRPQP